MRNPLFYATGWPRRQGLRGALFAEGNGMIHLNERRH